MRGCPEDLRSKVAIFDHHSGEAKGVRSPSFSLPRRLEEDGEFSHKCSQDLPGGPTS